MSELLTAVRAARAADIPGIVKPLTGAERKTELAALKALRAELRDWSWKRWRERNRVGQALVVAGAGCITGAAAAADWIGARELRENVHVSHPLLLDILAERDPAWLGDLAHRLARRPATGELDYRLISGLVALAGCPAPADDSYVYGWVESLPTHGRLLPALRADPGVAAMVPRLFEAAETPASFGWQVDTTDPHHWPTALTVLAEEGVLERRVLVDGAVARLLRGGAPGDAVFFLNLLVRLELTPDEERDRLPDWTGMAADGISTVAGHAQAVVSRLALGGGLSARSLADVSGALLFRPEKKLVRAQLILLGKVLRADPGAAGELLPVIAETFGHEDTALQERALKLVARHLPAVDEDIRSDLAASAGLLATVHRARAVEVFGADAMAAESVPYEEILPPVPLPVRTEPAPADLAELVEEVAALISARGGPASFERALDGLVRHAYRDRTALADALRVTLADCWWLNDLREYDPEEDFARETYGVEVVAASLCERISLTSLRDAGKRAAVRHPCAHTVLDGVLDARLREAAYLVRTRPLPFLLAAPTWETGALDPEVLVERLAEYRRLGADPAPVDFAQALLRVRRDGPPEAARAAAALGTPEGDRLAAWLTGEGPALPAPASAGEREPRKEGGSPEPGRSWLGSLAEPVRRLAARRARLAAAREFPPVFHPLGHPDRLSCSNCYRWEGNRNVNWTAVLPEDRDTLAGWLVYDVAECALADQRGGAWWLPLVAESGGPAGVSLHRAVAYGLGSRHPQDRLAAVDALLVLAARGDLDGRSLGEELAALVAAGDVKPNRLADSARTAAGTGAYATVWSVLGAALPELLAKAAAGPGAARAGLGEILSVAADCAERCRATAEISGLAELAERGGSSRAATQAVRLLATVRHGSDHSAP
ncbi:DUF7824 domain-containing protein [Streptomyces paludis]|uniref:DUF7824 domain-containing protein n=1 Tax=Streptomyces paludis TaxID=2282738 RepID=A0A345HJ15_9ACTN|nr:DUF6493 family protein [Streptomyces paludis]AXG76689.1 hypothetical protein DVK44_02230 [Streptomyces paludis]